MNFIKKNFLFIWICVFFSCTNDKIILLDSVLIEEIIVTETDSLTTSTTDNNPDIPPLIADLNKNSIHGYGFGVETDLEIATWPNFKKAAITHTWDDSNPRQIDVALPIYNSFEFVTTLFTLPNNVKNWEDYKNAYDKGHEIASHSINHPSFANINSSEIENELLGSKNMINAKLGFEAIYTFAYPFCAKETFGLTQKYYIAARSCKNDIEASTPKDFMDIGAVLCGSGTNYKSSTDFNGFAEKALAFNGWGVYLFHEIDGSGGNSIKSNDLSEHLAFLKKNNNSYWVDTFLNVVKYIKERNAVKVILGEVNDNVITINLSDGLDDTIYNYPLTIKKELPENWNINNIKVKHAGTLISHKLLQIANKNYIIFNAVPDQGKVEILKKS